MPLDFATYQKAAFSTAVYPGRGEGNWTYAGLGLAGETGEVCEKLKKTLRDHGGLMSDDRKAALKKELGDVLWYLATLCTELGLSLQDVAEENLSKLAARKRESKLHGEGDDR